ncbi:type IV pilus secretin PilQ [Desulfobacula sp.]
MPFPQMKTRINMMDKMLGVFLAVFIVAGCMAPKTKNLKTAEKIQISSGISDKSAIISQDRQISAVSFELKDQRIEIKIQGNQKLVYTSIKQSFPFGIVLYFPKTGIAQGVKADMPENDSIGDLTVSYVDQEMTTAKIEILLKQDLNYEVIENNRMLTVALSYDLAKNKISAKKVNKPLLSETHNNLQESPASEETIIIPDETAIMTDIEFNTMEDGKSNIIVQTNHPIKYDITQDSDNNKLFLNLYNTLIPEYHKRPLLTQYFKSAVKSLLPIQVPGEKKNSKIEIKIRDQVPYRVVQTQNNISLFFEQSSVNPPVFKKAMKKDFKESQIIGVSKPTTIIPDNPPSIADKKQTLDEPVLGLQKKYTGEKIKLDFYETDIKNVFRILRSVGKLNFAIDRDVQGKVTLTLEDPVPWDQVLDLVLRMNNLGMKKEGNVIRIATLETLNKEEKLMQANVVARQKSLEQKKSLEPLFTEYIPVNYSDATADIKPHIDQILTKDRGRISVDKRTNMVIITDTKAKIDQAREIIFRLDKVTPQIMIEAKVVEVSKNFSRELGLGLSFEESQTEYTGRSSDFTVALNNPVSSPANAGSFNFYRILGSNFLSMNAQIAASETKGDVKVVSSPRILTLDNKKAKIKQGLEYAYFERDDTGGSSVKFKNIDLLLEVTPHVTPDNRISMNIYLTKNDVDSVTDGVPSLSTNEAETELLINNNDTIVIGGIVKTTKTDSSSGTPILSSIPYLGRLFRTDSDSNNRNELLIFITPSIVQLEQKRNTYSISD